MSRSPVSFPGVLFSVCLLLLSGLQTVCAQVQENTRWRDAIVSQLDVDFGGTGFHARWNFHRCQCGDLRVMVEQVAPDGVMTGELLMVNGQVLLARDFEELDMDVEPLIQAPSLMLHLANAMLNRRHPSVPYVVDVKQLWDVTE